MNFHSLSLFQSLISFSIFMTNRRAYLPCFKCLWARFCPTFLRSHLLNSIGLCLFGFSFLILLIWFDGWTFHSSFHIISFYVFLGTPPRSNLAFMSNLLKGLSFILEIIIVILFKNTKIVSFSYLLAPGLALIGFFIIFSSHLS